MSPVISVKTCLQAIVYFTQIAFTTVPCCSHYACHLLTSTAFSRLFHCPIMHYQIQPLFVPLLVALVALRLTPTSSEETLAEPESEVTIEVPTEHLVPEEVQIAPKIVNTTIPDSELIANANTTTNNKYVHCLPNMGNSEIQLVNDTEIMKLLAPDVNVTSREIPANCILVLFYARVCPFSSMAAPHFNALPRAFPDIKMVAMDSIAYHIFNTQNGIVGVPSILLFHSGRPVGKYNETDYTLELFSKFVTKLTGIPALQEHFFVTSADFSGPVVSVPSKDSDMFLIMSWLFILICAVFFFAESRCCQWIVETVKSNWRESEAQHEHVD